jgi:hypothetical protein
MRFGWLSQKDIEEMLQQACATDSGIVLELEEAKAEQPRILSEWSLARADPQPSETHNEPTEKHRMNGPAA